MSNLAVYNLGELGVNTDKSPLHLEDGELTSAQNAMKDPLGVLGGLVKRPGLAKFNSVAGAGSIAGGIGVPLVKVNTRSIFVGNENSSGVGVGWVTSTTGFTTSAAAVTVPQSPVDYVKVSGFYGGGIFQGRTAGTAGIPFNNVMIYAGNTYTQGTDAPPMRSYDGVTDKEIGRVPTNPSIGVPTQAVMSVLNANGTIYLSTYDSGTTSADFKGRVFQFTPSTGVFTPLGPTFPAGYLPYALAWHAGRLWVGTSSQDITFVGRVYWFRPGIDTAWTLDFSTAAGIGDIVTMLSFRGELYAGTAAKSGSSAIVTKRSSLGVWGTVDTGADTGAQNYYSGAVLFNNAFYISYIDSSSTNILRIRKFDGTIWSTAYTAGVNDSGHLGIALTFVDNGILYAMTPGRYGGAGARYLLTTPDGAAWTDRSANSTGSTIPVYGIIYS